MILVDTCVLLDVVQNDPRWADWSLTKLEYAAEHGGVVVNSIVYVEFSVWYEDVLVLDSALADFGGNLQGRSA